MNERARPGGVPTLGRGKTGVREWRCGIAAGFSLIALLLALAPSAAAATNTNSPARSALDPVYRVGSWIWTEKTYDKQTCRFWKLIEIPRGTALVGARLRITADNSYRLFFDGREVGRGVEWRALAEYDLTMVLTPGRHVLAVEVYNDYAEAGLLAGLRLELADGRILEFPTDETWRIVPNDERLWATRKTALERWRPATVVGPFGQYPWTLGPMRILRELPLQPELARFWQSAWFQITLLSVSGLVILICLRLAAQLAVQKGAQRILQRERARIARDLHDDLGAGLTQLMLFGEVAQSEAPPGSEARAKFGWFCERSRGLLGTIDDTVWAVNSRRDTFGDFEAYVCNYAEKFLKPTPIHCRLEADTDIPDRPFALASRRNLFLAIKEALNNAVKHSGATELVLHIHLQGNTVLVTVQDNGRGFEPLTANRERNGLSNMAQRTIEAGGYCRVTSQPGAGCRVEFSVPLVHPAHRSLRWRVKRADADAVRPARKVAAPPPQ